MTYAKPGFNYMIQHLEAERDLKLAVHTDRLRPLAQMPIDYRLKTPRAVPKKTATAR